jgi:hypothetical protein
MRTSTGQLRLVAKGREGDRVKGENHGLLFLGGE